MHHLTLLLLLHSSLSIYVEEEVSTVERGVSSKWGREVEVGAEEVEVRWREEEGGRGRSRRALRDPRSRFGRPSLLRDTLSPSTISAHLSISPSSPSSPRRRVGSPSLLRSSFSPSTSSAHHSISPSFPYSSSSPSWSGRRVGSPSLLRSSISPSTTSAHLFVSRK